MCFKIKSITSGKASKQSDMKRYNEIGSDDNINIGQGRLHFQKHEISKKKVGALYNEILGN